MEEKKDIFNSEKWKKLKPQYRIAIEEYCKNYNKTQAYLKAYPKSKTAQQSSTKLFDRQDVKEVLTEVMNQIWEEERESLRATIGARLKKRAFTDFSNIKGVDVNTELAEITEVEIIEAYDKNGDPANCIKYKTASNKSLELLAKISGILEEKDTPKDFTIYINPVEKEW